MMLKYSSTLQLRCIAYTGIAYVLARRWASYRQGRSIFKRMLAWWAVAGDNPTEVATAVATLEECAMRVKNKVLTHTNDGVFGNRTAAGGVRQHLVRGGERGWRG